MSGSVVDKSTTVRDALDVEREEGRGWVERGFMLACRNGDREMVSLLLEDSRIDVHKRHRSGWTGFMHAYWNGNRDIVSVLSECKRVDCVCGDEMPLMRLAEYIYI